MTTTWVHFAAHLFPLLLQALSPPCPCGKVSEVAFHFSRIWTACPPGLESQRALGHASRPSSPLQGNTVTWAERTLQSVCCTVETQTQRTDCGHRRRGWDELRGRHGNIHYHMQNRQPVGICCRELRLGLSNNLEGWDGVGGGRQGQEGGNMCISMCDSCRCKAATNATL